MFKAGRMKKMAVTMADDGRTREDLMRLLAKIEGQEGQHERALAIRAKLEALRNEQGE